MVKLTKAVYDRLKELSLELDMTMAGTVSFLITYYRKKGDI
jgi:hypothetical protein